MSAPPRALAYLDVPFAEKDAAKHRGARWDPTVRRWYVPVGADVEGFSRWWPAGHAHHPYVRAVLSETARRMELPR